MPTLDLWTYLLAIAVLTLTPGVDTLLVIRNSARGGVRDGVVTSLGICNGLFVHATISAVGISFILMQTAWAFSVLKIGGACYLVWLGIGSLRQCWQGRGAIGIGGAAQPKSRLRTGRAFREGFLSNVLNPKTALFYMAFLPQFIEPAAPALSQSLFLASLHFIMAMVWQCGVALTVDRARFWLTRPTVGRVFHGLTGGAFVAIGAKLAAIP